MTRANRIESKSTSGRENRATDVARKPCFVLEINHRAVLAFSASSLRSARVRVDEAWFVEELERLRSAGRSLLRAGDIKLVRPALPAEVAAVDLGRGLDEARGEDAKYGFAFLVPIEAPPH